MKSTERTVRVARLVRQELASMLLRDFEVPILTRVSITDAQVSPDLRYARIYYTLIGDAAEAERELAARELERVAPALRKQLAGVIRMKNVPALRFEWDTTLESARRIETIIDTLERPDADPEDPA
jgi:ribosome-binding factor A